MKILYVATVSGTINAFLIPHIKMLVDSGHDVDVACHITTPLDFRLEEYGCKTYELELSRSPMSKSNYRAYKKFKKIVNSGNYDIVHTHTPVASALVRLACKNIEQTKVFYTAHGFHFYQGAPIKNWMIFYPVEKFLSRYTDTLITINKEDYEIAKSKFHARRIKYVPGVGLNINKYKNAKVDKKLKKKELGIPNDSRILLSVGELNKNKNHEIVIEAIAKLDNQKIHYIVCGEGPLKSYLIDLSKKLGIEKQVHLVGFRKDIPEICKIADIFVFPSFREGLPVSLMESMASGLPVICSDIRGNRDLIESEKNGFLINPRDVEDLVAAIRTISEDYLLASEFSKDSLNRIESFSITNVLHIMNKIYLEK